MNQLNNNRSFYKGTRLTFKLLSVILLALFAWGVFVKVSAMSSSHKTVKSSVLSKNTAISNSTPMCLTLSYYKNRVQQAIAMYGRARYALIQEIELAKYAQYPIGSTPYGMWNDADRVDARLEGKFSKLTRQGSTYAKEQACHKGKDVSKVALYLYALSNLEIADNVISKARIDVVSKCNPDFSAYKPYIDAADQAVDMAKKDISGKFKAKYASDYMANMPNDYANMKDMQNLCR